MTCDMRGITHVPNPQHLDQQDILFFWANKIFRVDPFNGFRDTVELGISNFVNANLGTTYVGSLAAYNDMPRIFDQSLNDSVWLIGTQMTRSGWGGADWRRGIYLERTQHGSSIAYHINSIIDPMGTQVFEAVRCFCVSPFAQDNGRVIYAGGYDPDSNPSHLTAWIWKGTFSENTNILYHSRYAKIDIYPNPSNTKITIEVDNTQLVNYKLRIYNLSGQELIRQNLTDTKTQIDISNLPSEIYFIKLITDKTIEVRKIIKE